MRRAMGKVKHNAEMAMALVVVCGDGVSRSG